MRPAPARARAGRRARPGQAPAALSVDGVEAPLAASRLAHQAGFAQHLEVVRDLGLRQAVEALQLAHADALRLALGARREPPARDSTAAAVICTSMRRRMGSESALAAVARRAASPASSPALAGSGETPAGRGQHEVVRSAARRPASCRGVCAGMAFSSRGRLGTSEDTRPRTSFQRDLDVVPAPALRRRRRAVRR